MRRIALLICIACAGATTGAAAAAPAQPTQRLVAVLSSQTVRAAPSPSAHAVGTITSATPITGVRSILPVLADGPPGWVRVALPGRPNGHSGWIRSGTTKPAETTWHLVIDLSLRRVTVFSSGRAVRSFRAVVGKPSTPTPTGAFFIEEPVRLGHSEPGGPYALALSARSNVLQEFDGGPGQIAIHGRDNVGGIPGTAASHGCVRLADAAIEWLAGRMGAGTPVTITP